MPVPRMPFSAVHILKFLGMAWISEDLRVWQGVLPHVICFQQLMRVSEVASLRGSNVIRSDDGIRLVNVKAKNHGHGYPQPLFFPVDEGCRHCFGFLLTEYMPRFGIVAGEKTYLLACKIGCKGGVYSAPPTVGVSLKTVWDAGKDAIKGIGLDATRYASHSAKRGGALAAVKAGLNSAQLTLVGNWASSEMAARYLEGSEAERNRLVGLFRT
jgi:hypothetical protein